jgi:hypothetical protein
MNNDQVILRQILKAKAAELEESVNESDYFELFSASELLKDYELTYDDVEYGIVGNGGDGGIDSVFVFLNGELLKEDTEVNTRQKHSKFEIHLIQAKTSPNFKEDAIMKFRESAEDLFNLSHDDLNLFASRYNSTLLQRIEMFRSTYRKMITTIPNLELHYYYVTHGVELHPNVVGKVDKLRETIASLFGNAKFEFDFVGARELLQKIRDVPSTTRSLEFVETPVSTSAGSYVCLVTLPKYYEFICDAGKLSRSIFESNVRDYQGSVVVNTGIRKTLSNPQSEDFWYLNNGVTIITPHAVASGKTLTIEEPQIVNGLQTSHEIYEYFSQLDKLPDDNRRILVRIIAAKDEEARDRIIKATNSQTAIPPASLRSSDEVHRNIEDFFKANGYFYDRKKNFYKNEGKPVSKIISIPYLAQTMISIVLQRPDSARARPSTLINSEADYKQIYSRDMPIDVYLKAIQIMKSVEAYLRSSECPIELERKDSTNVKFYIAMVVAYKLVSSTENLEKKLSELPNVVISNDLLTFGFNLVWQQYQTLGGNDQVAKGVELLKSIKVELSGTS